jgi:hypothetical protein
MMPARSHGAKLFFGAKAAGGIPITSPLLEDALIQASLDPEIERIERLAISHPSVAEAYAVLLRKGGRRLILDVVRQERRGGRAVGDDQSQAAVARLGLGLLRRSHADVRREPFYSNCKLVWSYVHHRVLVGDRIRIMQMLAEEGPLRIGDLVGEARFQGDPSAALMALACHDVVELDFRNAALGPGTVARIRTRKE